jgi:hypothetical protein
MTPSLHNPASGGLGIDGAPADGQGLAFDEGSGLWVPTDLVRKASSYIPDEESTTSSSFTAMDTPDVVTLVLEDGEAALIQVLALYKHTGASGAGEVTMFVDGVQSKAVNLAGAPLPAAAAAIAANATAYGVVCTTATSVAVIASTTTDTSYGTAGVHAVGGSYSGLQILGLPAGSHDFELRVKAGTGGTVWMKERRMAALAI